MRVLWGEKIGLLFSCVRLASVVNRVIWPLGYPRARYRRRADRADERPRAHRVSRRARGTSREDRPAGIAWPVRSTQYS